MIEVIMPVYNTPGKIFDNSIASVIAQTRDDWKMWIVNDGSTDDTALKILDKYRHYFDTRITVIDKENGGVSSARNLGLSKVSSDSYIAYLDSDDHWNSNHLQKSIETLERGFDVTYCNPIVVDENGTIIQMNFKLYDEFNAKRFKFGNFIFISTVVHRNCLEMFDSALDSLEDYDMWVRATKNGQTFCQHETTAIYFAKPDGLAGQGRNVLPLVHQKHSDFFKTRLHLGCGDQYLDDYVNCDLYSTCADVKLDCATMRLHDYPLDENLADEIMAYHLIEHFDFVQGQDVLREWYRLLKPGGRLHIETPDMLNTCKEFVEAGEQCRIQLYSHFWAWPWLPGQVHKFLYTETQLFWLLNQLGFRNIRRLCPDSVGVEKNNITLFLNVEAFK